MANLRWLEEMRQTLSEQKLPPVYIERLLEELSDHITDLMEEQRMEGTRSVALEERLGQPAEIAAGAAVEYRQRFFCRRHPVLTFAVLPLPLLAILFFGVVTLALGAGEGLKLASENYYALLLVACPVSVILPAILVAGTVSFLAARTGQSWRWPMFSCILTGGMASLICWQVHPHSLILGVAEFFGLAQFMQLLVPVVIGIWCNRRRIWQATTA